MHASQKFRFGSLDCLRGLFASMVVFHHMIDYTSSPVIHNNFFAYSNLFVDFFFVLSGFVISYSYPGFENKAGVLRFYRKRILRLYPLHFILLLVFLAFETAKYFAAGYIQFNGGVFETNNIGSFCISLLLLNSIKWPFIDSLSWNYPSWSISAEMIAYVFYSLVTLSTLIYLNQRYRTAVFLSSVIAGFALLYFLRGNLNIVYTYDLGFVRGIIGFSTGVLCYRTFALIYPKIKNGPRYWFTLLEGLSMLLTVFLVINWPSLQNHGYVYELLFFFAILTFAFERGAISHFLNSIPFFTRLGTYSYSIYMNHAIIGILFNVFFIRILKLPDSSYSYLFILNFLIVFYISRWTFHHIELYFQKRFSREPAKILIKEDQKFSF